MNVLLFFRLLCLGIVFAADPVVVNRTIDDTIGDLVTGERPIFLPAELWQGPDCVTYSIKPDPQNAFSGTFTAASNFVSRNSGGVVTIDFRFEGTAIWIFFILANYINPNRVYLTEVTITIDGGAPTLFQHNPDPSTTELLYNQLVYSQMDLEKTKHSIQISSSPTILTWVNFDYAIYTYVYDDGIPDDSYPQAGTSASSELDPCTTTSTDPLTTSTLTTSTATTLTTSATGQAAPTSSATVATERSQTSAGVVTGSIIGSGAGVALLLYFSVLFRRRQRASRHTGETYNIPSHIPRQDGLY